MSELVLVVYSRPACHLCDDALAALRPLLVRLPIRVVVRNVDKRPEWERRYGHQVPVGFLGDRKLFKYSIDPARVERALRAALRPGADSASRGPAKPVC